MSKRKSKRKYRLYHRILFWYVDQSAIVRWLIILLVMSLIAAFLLQPTPEEAQRNLNHRATADARSTLNAIYLKANPPTITPTPTVTPTRTPYPQSFICPRNCTEARQRGVSAFRAAQCGLDADGDGVACYGD